jgi:hypothetical protein
LIPLSESERASEAVGNRPFSDLDPLRLLPFVGGLPAWSEVGHFVFHPRMWIITHIVVGPMILLTLLIESGGASCAITFLLINIMGHRPSSLNMC